MLPAPCARSSRSFSSSATAWRAGYGLPQGRGWVDLLRRKLDAERLDYRVVNASISGETTLGGRNRLGAALEQHRPRIVILELGSNDGLRGQPLDLMRDNLVAMMQGKPRRRGARAGRRHAHPTQLRP